jgi:hypothetical protein
MERVLKTSKILETVQGLTHRIGERFPKSGLASVAGEIEKVVQEALVRAETIRRPNYWLRGGLLLVAAAAVTGVLVFLYTGRTDEAPLWQRLLQFLKDAGPAAAYLTALALFLVTLEVRLKRRRAIQAIHELRAMAHIIDMHQLAKDPDLLGHPDNPVRVADQVLDSEGMGRYLHYCTELLAIISKIGQLYVQDFADGTALAAVDQFEALATGLSHKIWQKLMILDRLRSSDIPKSAKPAPLPAPKG